MRGAHHDPAAPLAARYIEATLGVAVHPWDTRGRQGAHDLRYEHEGRSVAVEVKRVLDDDLQGMYGAVNKIRYVQDGRLTRRWDVRLRHDARVSEVRKEIPAVLVLLEETGWLDVSQLWRLRQSNPWLRDWLEKLGVVHLWGDPPTDKHPAGFRLMPVGWGSFGEGVNPLVSFTCELLASKSKPMETLRRQLRDAEADERHAFLFIGPEYTEGWSLMSPTFDEETALPTKPPALPDPINGLWLTSESARSRLIAWLPRTGWIEGKAGAASNS